MSAKLVQFPTPVPKATDRRIPPASEMLRRHPWLTESGAKMIVSADLDGMISALIMRHLFHWEIVGWYNTYGISLREDVDPAECIGVDSEFLTKTRHSIGHHFALSGDHQLNINAEANVIPSPEWLLKTPQHTVESLQPYFVRKYNLALAIFLFYLFREQLQFPHYELPIALLLTADSSWETYYKYAYDKWNPNPLQHLEAMNMWQLQMKLHENRDKNNLRPSEKDLENHPIKKYLSLHTNGFFIGNQITGNVNAPCLISNWNHLYKIRQLLVSLNSVFGFRTIKPSELNFKEFRYRKLHYYFMRFSPEFFPELKKAGLWTHAILNCGRDGIRFGITTDCKITAEEFPLLNKYVVGERFHSSRRAS